MSSSFGQSEGTLIARKIEVRGGMEGSDEDRLTVREVVEDVRMSPVKATTVRSVPRGRAVA